MSKTKYIVQTSAGLAMCMAAAVSYAEDATATATASATTTAAAPAAPAAPTLNPTMAGPLTANATPFSIDSGALGKVYVGGAVTGLYLSQDNGSGGKKSQVDLNNAQVFIQKVDGQFQFYSQFGQYSFPTLGSAYVKASDATKANFGSVPVYFLKYAPTDAFSVQAGNLTTLIGDEYNFDFQDVNIQRGLLWNQENLVNRGVQANYTTGPLALSASVNDGFYSKRFTWVDLSATYTIDKENTLAVVLAGNTKKQKVSTSVTPVLQNNSQIANVIYTHTAGPWMATGYAQYTRVPASSVYGTTKAGSTTGVAGLVSYAVGNGFSLGGRAEYIKDSGSKNGAPDLLGYGVGSNAYSLTFTPTYQYKNYFTRAEYSFVKANDTTGAVFGTTGKKTFENRGLLEVGVLF